MGGLALQMYNVYVFEHDECRRRVEFLLESLLENNQKMVYLCKVFFFSRRLVKTYLPKKKEEDDYQ